MSLKDIFPKCKSNWETKKQFGKILEEIAEVEIELNEGNKDKMLNELLDVMRATANTIYSLGYNDEHVNETLYNIRKKNYNRGYYEDNYKLK